ncbi:cupin domain-containing protein [Pseudonocardia hispaniensis]|uniref:Cupin domain-containing protein n=1 Tax=Pseudonocardia hispaniensis TaxID=904933 RepID=A0ABW1J6H7_9PSEU
MTVPDSRGEPVRAAGWEPIVSAIGPKVREVRQQLGLSLQQLAARSDVSAAAIHKVERGDMVPTITTLLKLAAALDRPIGFFVEDAGPEKPVAVHVRAAGRPGPPPDWVPEAEGVVATALAVPDERLRGAAVQADIAPGGSSGDTRPLRAGEELLLVVTGALVVEVAGERYRVQAGDTLHYPTDRPHSWHNPGAEPVRAIWWMLRA